ncbi:hypothetical protein Q6346_03405 [Isoptericola sp. b490]|uniref:membrane protein YczE n=1 Tax=Actinotalea lenta TaxID=3064654 RepID=UPI002712EF94|nr:hypothetical protein [Isoptericola sp. b490]MDO8120358.1 hypothetical protein [Isoptericola sp. b490]
MTARVVQLLTGLVAYAVSIALVVRSGLGSMPWDVLHQGLAAHTRASFGLVTAVTGAAVLVCWAPLRQRPGVGTVANVLVISAAVNPALALLGRLGDPAPLGLRVTMLLGGVALNGLATALYVGVQLGPGPRDGLMTGLVARTGWSLRLVRTGIEVTVVAVGWLLGGTVGPGTVLYAAAVGPLVHGWLPVFTRPAGRREVGPASTGQEGNWPRPTCGLGSRSRRSWYARIRP